MDGLFLLVVGAGLLAASKSCESSGRLRQKGAVECIAAVSSGVV